MSSFISARSARRVAIAALALMAASAGPASAQFFGPWFGPSRPPFVGGGPVIPPRLVAAILRGHGVRMTDLPARSGDRIIALGVDERGQMMRFVLDAQDGAVIRSALVGAPRPPGYVGSERDVLAHAGPILPSDPVLSALPGDLPAEKPKSKTKTKTAAKPPAAPEPAPAAPAALPSKATVAPSPIVPPAAAVAPAATANPETRLAPDAQPDIGPKVVPVKPAEARAPDTTPIADAPIAPVPAPAANPDIKPAE